jgi:hypothetical protein
MTAEWVLVFLLCGANRYGITCEWKEVFTFPDQARCVQTLQNGARNIAIGQDFVIAECKKQGTE